MADPTTPSPLSQALAQIGPSAPPAPSMSPLSTQLRSLAEDKQARVAQAAAEKRDRMDPGQTALRSAMAREEGNLTGYDPSVDTIARSVQQVQIRDARGMGRDNGQVLGDSALGAGAGFVSTIGNVAAGAAGIFSDRAGAVVSGAVDDASSWLRDQQSTALTRTRELDGVRAELDRADIAQRYEQDVAAGRSYPGARRLGREIAEQSEALWDNPRLAGDVASEGVGSMAAITGAAMAGVPVPLAVGVTEGAGAYAQAMNDVQGMDETQLARTSPEYRSLREQGVSHEAARDRLGGQAGRTAGVIQGIVGAVTGNLVKHIEGNPMRLPGSESLVASLRSLGSDTLRETVEETTQSVTGTMAGNYAIQQSADETRGIMDNVGAEAVTGAVGGMGTTAMLRAPEVAAVGTITAAETAARNIAGEAQTIYRGAERVVNERLERINAGREDSSPVSPARVAEARVSVDTGLRAAVTALEPMAAPVPTITEDTGNVAEDPVQASMARIRERIVPMLDLDAAEFNSAPQAVRNIASEGQTAPDDFVQPRVNILAAVTEAIDKGEGSPEDQAASALWVYAQAQRYEALRNEDLSILPQGPADVLGQALSSIDTILESPSIKRAIKKAVSLEAADLGPLPEVTAESVSDPAVQTAVASVALLAEVSPDAVGPRFAHAVLNQHKAGTLSLAPRQVQALESAAEISRAVADAMAEGEGSTVKTRDIVRKEIRNDGFDGNTTGARPSLRQHIQDVTSSAGQGDMALVASQLERLKGLAEHYQNKVAAAQASARLKRGKDNAIPYRTWTGEEWLDAAHKSAGSIYVNPFSEASIATARAVETEARLVTRVYNALAKSYGAELSAEPLTELKPVPEFEGLGKAKRQPQATAPESSTPNKDTTDEPTMRNDDVDTGRREDGKDVGGDLRKGTQGAPEVPGSDAAPEGRRDAGTEPAGDAVSGAEDRVDAEPRTNDDDNSLTEGDPELVEDPVENVSSNRDLSNLPKRGDLNRVERAYAFGTGRSRLAGITAPMRFMVDWLRSFTSDDQQVFTYEMTPERRQLLSDLLEKQGGAILNKMNARLKDPKITTFKGDNKGVLTPLEAVSYVGKDFLGMRAGRALNLVDTTTGKYDADLVQGALLAAFDWILTSDPVPTLNDEKIRKMFGLESEALLTDGARQAANHGYGQDMAAASLGQSILEFWNATSNPDAPMSDTQGIVQALAAEILTAMDGSLVEQKRYEIGSVFNEKTGKLVPTYQDTIRLSHPATKELVRKLSPARRFIGDAVLAGRDQPYYFDDQLEKLQAVGTVSRVFKQKRGPGRVGQTTSDAIEAHRSIGFFRNTPYVALMKALGEETYGQLMGFRKVDPDTTHVRDLVSIAGKNASITQSYLRTLEHDTHLEEYAASTGKNPDEVATRYDWAVGTQERIMAQGFNGQGNKHMRHAFPATVATLDMTTQNGKDRFWLTVAQNTGVKTEKSRRKSNATAGRKAVYKRYGDSIEVLAEWLDAGQGEISPEQQAVLTREIGAKGDPMLLDALVHVAKYKTAQKRARGRKGDKTALTAFETMLPLEADGKTDGPINSLVHFLTGPFTKSQLLDFMRGGLFLGERDRTLNSAAKLGDLYTSGAKVAQNYLKAMRDHIAASGNRDVLKLRSDLLRFMGEMGELVIVQRDDGGRDITIGRNTMKNPLTITVYGSSAHGIADKLANSVVKIFYARLTELEQFRKETNNPQARLQDLPGLENYPLVLEDLKSITTRKVFPGKKDPNSWWISSQFKDAEPVAFGNGKSGKDFVLNDENVRILTANLQTLLVKPMVQAIDDSMGGAIRNLQVVQLATQLQSRVLMGVFDKAVQETLEARRSEGKLASNEFLSEKDYKAVFARLAKYGAVVSPVRDNEHDLVLSAKEKGDAGVSFFNSLDEGFRGNALLARPKHAGVSAAPMLNISRGDATMMINYFAKAWAERNSIEADGSKAMKVLPVYDGLNMPADGLEEISERINAALTEAWLENPMADVAESFTDFLRQGEDGQPIDLESLPNVADFHKDIARFDENLEYESLEEVLTRVNAQLSEIALEAQARKNVMKRVGFSNDHMASAETPHIHGGEFFAGPAKDLELRAQWLNRHYERELAKLRKAQDAKAPVTEGGVAKPDPRLEALVAETGVSDSRYPSLRHANTKGVLALLTDPEVTFSPESKAVLQKLARMLPRYRFVLGSSEEVNAYRNAHHPEQAHLDPIEHGQTDLANQVIYITNQASETVLHEMLHAAMMGQLYRYYSYPATLSADEQAAVKNLEALMGQFLSMSFLREDPEVARSAALAQAAIRGFSGQDNPFAKAAMVSEFVSWTLVNQNLAETLKTAKTRVKLSRLGDLVRKAVGAFKRLMGLQNDQTSMFVNIATNTAALLETADPASVQFRNIPAMLLNQLSGLPSDGRIAQLSQNFQEKIQDHLSRRDPKTVRAERAKLENRASSVEALVALGGFALDPEQAHLFVRMQAAFATTMEMDKRALVRVARIYDHVIKNLTAEGLMDDPDANLPADKALAEQRLKTLQGQLDMGGITDLEGRPMILAVFLALSQTDPNLRRALGSMRLPKDREVSFDSMDEFLTSSADSLMNTLASTISGEDLGNKASGPALDRLAVILGRIETDRHSLVEKKIGSLLGEGENRLHGWLQDGSERLVQWAEERQQDLPPGGVDYLAKGATALATLVDEERGELAAKAVKSWANQWAKGPEWIKDGINEVIGTTDETATVNLMVNEVRYGVQRMRQEYREDLPKIFAEQFSHEITDAEWQAMHTGIARTDLGALGFSMSVANIRRMYTDAKFFKREKDKTLERVKTLAKGRHQDYFRKVDDLARFMVTGEIDSTNHQFQRNAYAIARLMDPSVSDSDVEAMREQLDRLVTIFAIELLDPDTKASLETLARDEPAGLEFMIYYASSLRETEAMKIADSGEIAKLNSYKGYVPMETREGLRLVVQDASEHSRMLEMGYTRVGEYKGSGFEPGKKSYYFSTVAGNATYNQSAMQTVHTTTGGVDPVTGTTLTGITAGRIQGKNMARIQAAVAGGKIPSQGKEVLMPIYGLQGQVVAYERHLDPGIQKRMQPNQQLDEMLGAWAGRQVEEYAAQQYNQVLVERLGARWDEDKADRNREASKEYVNLADPDLEDPVLKDIWSMVPREARAHAASVFGEQNVFMVRRDMLHNALGYRMPSVGDLWIGQTRMDPANMAFLRKAATAFLGAKSFEYLVRGEKFAQTAVSVAKSTIVVKSVIVPMFNALSTMKQLIMNGVSPRTIAREYPTKLVEIERHLKNLDRKVEINAEMTAYRKDKARLARLQAELTSIEESSKRMSIWPLIEAGEFMTISEGMTEADAALTEGRFAEYAANLMERIPQKLGTVGRYAMITRDTALFQGMARAVQYGDFLGKAVLYDHLIKTRKLSHKDAMRLIHDEFVAYNLLPGRTRSYLESLGLTWFWAFKLRSLKIALRHLRNNPLKSLLAIGGTEYLMPDLPGGSVGDPILDNMITHVGEGRLGGSTGLGMLFRAPEMHPVLGSIM